MILLQTLLLLLLTNYSLAALPACASGVRCPPGGLWSEWAVSGQKTCPMSCGSCGKLFYTRSCLSASANCSCTGDTSKYTLCNTQGCEYPSQQTCCTPYVSMIINGTLQCGPIPRDTSGSSTPCCPVGGLWSDWSGFARNGSSWYQTRQCLSASLDCPCTGSAKNTQTGCPCPAFQTPEQVRALCMIATAEAFYTPNNYVIDQDTCEMVGICKANNLDDDWPCYAYDTYKTFLAGKIRLKNPDGVTCYEDRPYDCDARLEYGASQLTLNISFTCDPSIQQWRYDALGVPVIGYEVIQISYRGGG